MESNDNSIQTNDNGVYYIPKRNNSLSIPQIIIAREFRRHMNSESNQETIQSKSSIGSVGRLKQMLKVVDANRQNRSRKFSVSYLGTTLPDQLERFQTSNYRRKFQVYNLLHRPRRFWAFSYHIVVFLMVFFCLILTVLSTDHKFEDKSWQMMVEMEKVMLVWFGTEFLVRLWASSCKTQYQGWAGKFRYLKNLYRIGDIIIIIVSIVLLWVDSADGHLVFAAFALRGCHRFFQVIQMIKSERQFRPAIILSNVLSTQREQLIIVFYIGFLVLCFMAFLIYLVETDYNDNFDNIADSFYWAVITIFTIGYGDRVPVTYLGKLITCVFTILGVSIFALPAGIIGTGLAINVSDEQRAENRYKKKLPAAVLIQNCWRYYAANPESLSIATWTIYSRNHEILTETDRNAIRFIRMIKFLLAKQDFEARKSQTDIRDVLEQYRIGHSSLLYRIKEIQSDLALIVGKVQTNGKRVQESKTGLIERIESLEKMQNLFNRKLDLSFDLLLSQIQRIEINTQNNQLSGQCLPINMTLNSSTIKRRKSLP